MADQAEQNNNATAGASVALVKAPSSALQAPGAGPGTGISAPVSQTGVNHLAMNVFVPGLGSLVRGKRGLGAAQLALALLGIPVMFKVFFLGLAMFVGAYVWSIVTGVGFLKSQDELVWR